MKTPNTATDLTPISKLILESLLIGAEELVERKKKRGKDEEEAISEVSDEMLLNSYETDKLTDRVKNKPVENSDTTTQNADMSVKPLSIYFENTDELGQAVQILMDRAIAWNAQGTDGSRSYVQFSEEDHLLHAQNALQRRWNFVENNKRLVADVQFDNLSDYNKVMEFMRRQGMLLEFNQGIDLDEDRDEIENQKAVAKKLADKEGKLYEENADLDLKSYVARPRTIDKFRIDPLKESKYRTAYVRKRWR